MLYNGDHSLKTCLVSVKTIHSNWCLTAFVVSSRWMNLSPLNCLRDAELSQRRSEMFIHSFFLTLVRIHWRKTVLHARSSGTLGVDAFSKLLSKKLVYLIDIASKETQFLKQSDNIEEDGSIQEMIRLK